MTRTLSGGGIAFFVNTLVVRILLIRSLVFNTLTVHACVVSALVISAGKCKSIQRFRVKLEIQHIRALTELCFNVPKISLHNAKTFQRNQRITDLFMACIEFFLQRGIAFL